MALFLFPFWFPRQLLPLILTQIRILFSCGRQMRWPFVTLDLEAFWGILLLTMLLKEKGH